MSHVLMRLTLMRYKVSEDADGKSRYNCRRAGVPCKLHSSCASTGPGPLPPFATPTTISASSAAVYPFFSHSAHDTPRDLVKC